MAIEVEAKLRADGPGPLAALATILDLGPASLGPAVAVDEVDRYLDTTSGALAAARWACRLRERGGAFRLSLKGPREDAVPDVAGVHRRPEVEGPATDDPDPSAWPPSAARDLLLDLTQGATLREQLRLRQRRTERAVTIAGRRLATLTLDVVRIEADGRSGGTLHVVELELDPASTDDSALAEVARRLAAFPGLIPEPMTKLEIALARLGNR